MNIASVEIVQNIQLLRDAEVVHVSKGLLDEPGPLFGDSAHLVLPIRSHDLKLHVPGTGEGAPGALDDQGHVTVTVSDLKPDIACLDGIFTIVNSLLGLHARPQLVDISNDFSRGGADLQRLEAAGETARVAAERSVQVNDLPASNKQ